MYWVLPLLQTLLWKALVSPTTYNSIKCKEADRVMASTVRCRSRRRGRFRHVLRVTQFLNRIELWVAIRQPKFRV